MEFEIYFSDLCKEAQESLLDLVEAKAPEEMNWDVFPVATIYVEKGE